LRVPLVGREEVARDTWVLWFETPGLARSIQPGEFLMVGLNPPAGRAFLKRPFSVCDAVDGRVSLLLRTYGPGTAEMARRRIGDEFELLGPLGRGFRLDGAAARVVMVAGGVGLAPFYVLARRLKERVPAPETVLVYGERTREALTREVAVFPFFDRVTLHTDDGSAGRPGSVVDGFRGLAAVGELAGARVAACGPRRMLEALEVERERFAVPGEYSLEERMGCGFGICQGCVVPANPACSERAYHLLCKTGPVMNPELLLWPHQTLP
jgi:dihydroorotate dehydrogenase electron transfer subunit